MDTPDTQEIANHFSAIAQRFCDVIDMAERTERNSFLLQVYRVLLELIAGALNLPEVDATETAKSTEGVRPSDVEWKRINDAVATAIGDWNFYWQNFDPDKNEEVVVGSLADDLADIYRDVHEGMTLNRTRQSSPVNIVWEWRFSFYAHWGKHATAALYVIHWRASEILM